MSSESNIERAHRFAPLLSTMTYEQIGEAEEVPITRERVRQICALIGVKSQRHKPRFCACGTKLQTKHPKCSLCRKAERQVRIRV